MEPLLLCLLAGTFALICRAGGGGEFSPLSLPEEIVGRELDLDGFPAGETDLSDVPWKVHGEDGRPRCLEVTPGKTAAPIPAGLKATALQFLHALRPGPALHGWRRLVRHSVETGARRPDYPTVLRYSVRYADGCELTVPVRWGEGIEGQVRRTFEPVSRFIADLACARVAWKGPLDQQADQRPVVYAMAWPNPYPEKEIASIAVASAEGADEPGDALVFGITADHRERTGRVFYVAPWGDDGAPGTFDQPWGSLNKAARALGAGDTAYVRGGTYPVREVISPHNSGGEGAWITYAGFPGETAVLQCDGIHYPGSKNSVVIDNGRKITVVASRSGAFHILDRSYIRVRNLHFHDTAYEGIALDGLPWWNRELPEGFQGSHHIDILYNTTCRSVTTGIGVWGAGGAPVRHVRIIGNRVLNAFDPALILSTVDEGFQARERRALRRGTPVGEENLDVVYTWGFEVAHNEVSWGGKEGIDCKESVRGGDVHHNYCHDMFVLRDFPGGKVGIYIDSWYDDLCRIDVHHNVCERNGHGICLMNEGGSPIYDVKIRCNLCRDNYWWGICLRCNVESEEWVRDVEVARNTIYRNGFHTGNRSGLGGIALTSSTRRYENLLIRDNICVGNRDFPVAYHREADLYGRNVRMEHNLCWPLELRCRPGQAFLPTFGALPVLEEPAFIDPETYNFHLRPDGGGDDPQGIQHDLGAFPFDESQE
ncbi:MAG: right-handed parallel beta-helix repeat-containing protein [Candidatus Brocadiia bacterium]